MLVAIDHIIGRPVMGLQTGTRLAITMQAIIDPRNLSIAAFYVEGPLVPAKPSVLHASDIRELSDIGIIIDSDAKLMPLDDLVRLKEIIDFQFELVGLKVVDDVGHKLGKIRGFSVDTLNFEVQQVYTEQSIFRSINSVGSTIARSQILSVDNQRMVVQSPKLAGKVKRPDARVNLGAFVNPFRGSSQPESKDL